MFLLLYCCIILRKLQNYCTHNKILIHWNGHLCWHQLCMPYFSSIWKYNYIILVKYQFYIYTKMHFKIRNIREHNNLKRTDLFFLLNVNFHFYHWQWMKFRYWFHNMVKNIHQTMHPIRKTITADEDESKCSMWNESLFACCL